MDFSCVECRADADCEEGRCAEEGVCVDCLADADCPDGTCVEGTCRPAACNDAYEPNDDVMSAHQLQAGQDVAGAMHCGDDDYYVVNVPANTPAGVFAGTLTT